MIDQQQLNCTWIGPGFGEAWAGGHESRDLLDSAYDVQVRNSTAFMILSAP